jgi:hypothetical protein
MVFSKKFLADYKAFRAPRFTERHNLRIAYHTARQAIAHARYMEHVRKVDQEWIDMGGQTLDEWSADNPRRCPYAPTRVRIVVSEYYVDFDDMCGDMFCPRANPDIRPAELEREKEEYRERLGRDGVWHVESQYWDGDDWQPADSIGGIEGGSDDCYAVDLKRAAMDEYREHWNAYHERVARGMEADRPDMYMDASILYRAEDASI